MQYRVFYLCDSHIRGVEVIDCSEDAEATSKAKATGCYVELWQLARCVARIDSKGNISPSYLS